MVKKPIRMLSSSKERRVHIGKSIRPGILGFTKRWKSRCSGPRAVTRARNYAVCGPCFNCGASTN